MAYVSYNNTLAYLTNPGGLPNSNPSALGGLRFDGNSSKYFSAALAGQAISTNEFSIIFCFKVPSSYPSAGSSYGISIISASSGIFSGNQLTLSLLTGGQLSITISTEFATYVNASYANFIQNYQNKIIHLAFVRNSSGNPSIYINGNNANSFFTFSSGGITWQNSINSNFFAIGRIADGLSYIGDIYYASLYRGALSASTVSQIYFSNGAVPSSLKWGSFATSTNGAVVHYTFERNANDSSSNGLNGTVFGSPPFLSSSERFFATNFSAQNSTNFQRIKRIGKELDYYNQVGPKSSSISTTVVPVSGFVGNQINTFLSYTGDSVSGVSIQVPNYQFDKCFLKSMSVNFEPWKLAYANLQFDSYGLASGSGIYSNPPDDIAPSIITPLRATTITLLTGSGFNRNITEYENIAFDVSVDRAANFEIGQEYPTTVSVAKITKTLQINGISNLNWVSDYEPNKIISCNIGMVDGNSISVSGVVSNQTLSIDANGVAKTNLTVVEEMV